jgi:DNA-binding transcriptional regulator YbjK
MNYTIQNYVISVQWSDNPKLQTLHNNMPDSLRQDFDKWLSSIEHERNTIEGSI